MLSQRLLSLCAFSGTPVFLYWKIVRKSHSGRYFSTVPRCLAPTGSSLAGIGMLTCSHQCVENILTKFVDFVKENLCDQGVTIVSVILSKRSAPKDPFLLALLWPEGGKNADSSTSPPGGGFAQNDTAHCVIDPCAGSETLHNTQDFRTALQNSRKLPTWAHRFPRQKWRGIIPSWQDGNIPVYRP